MEIRIRWFSLLVCPLLLLLLTPSHAVRLISGKDDTTSAAFALVSDTAAAVTKHLGWNSDDFKISKIDTVDAKIGETVVYEFDLELENTVLPTITLSEEIKSWRYLVEDPYDEGDEQNEGGLDEWQPNFAQGPVLAPFELVGPLELWISEAQQMRLALPNDVEAGVLNRVLLADGAVVTVEGARKLSLARPLDLPLPLVGPLRQGGIAANLVDLASRLRFASQVGEKPLLSLQVVGPSSLIAASVRESDTGALKAKRLAPGAVELVTKHPEATKPFMSTGSSLTEGTSFMWPLPSLNGSNEKLMALEQALMAILGHKTHKRGAFKLLAAKASAASFVKFDFELEKVIEKPEQWPEWATFPAVERHQFQVLAKTDGQKLIPVRVSHMDPIESTMTLNQAELAGNVSFSKIAGILTPPGAMTLDLI